MKIASTDSRTFFGWMDGVILKAQFIYYFQNVDTNWHLLQISLVVLLELNVRDIFNTEFRLALTLKIWPLLFYICDEMVTGS